MKSLRIRVVFAVIAACIPFVSRSQCSTPVIADSTDQYLFNGNVNSMVKRGHTLYVAGDFNGVYQYTGTCIGFDTTTRQLFRQKTWPKVMGEVNKVISDNNGGVIIAGSFTYVGDSMRSYLAQIDSSGHVTALNIAFNGPIYSLALDGNKLYTGGQFSSVNGVTRINCAAVDISNGEVAAWDPQPNSQVYDMYLFNGSKYIGGSFTNAGAALHYYVAKVDTSGGAVSAWDPNISYSSDFSVFSLTSSGSKLYIAGYFASAGGFTHPNIVAVDTSTGVAATWNPQVNGSIYKIHIEGTKVFVGGNFSSAGTLPRNNIAAVDITTGLATGFVLSSTVDSPVLSGGVIDIVRYGSNLYLSGNNIVSVNPVTGAYTGFSAVMENSAPTYSLCAVGGKIFAGGSFTSVRKCGRPGLAAIDMDADTITSWAPPITGTINVMANGPSGIYLASSAGAHTNLPDVIIDTVATMLSYRSILIKVDTVQGAPILDFNAHFNQGINGMTYSNGQVFAYGFFTTISDSGRQYIGAVDANTGVVTNWAPYNHPFYYPYIYDILAVDTTIYIAGSFYDNFGGQPRQNLAAVSATSGLATTYSPNPDDAVNTLCYANGQLYAGGDFTTFGGVFAPRLAKVDRATGITSDWVPFPDSRVNKIVSTYAGKVAIAGEFYNVGTTPRYYFASLDSNSITPDAWDDGSTPYVILGNNINALETYHDKMYIAGDNLMYHVPGTSSYYGLARYKIPAPVTIVRISGNNAVCEGAPVTLAASSDASATYNWYVNGVMAGTGSTYTYVPTDGDQVSCIAYPAAGSCYPDTAVSNIITMVVQAPVAPPAVSISGASTVCVGAMTADTASSTATGATYTWKVNGTPSGSGSTFGYIPANGDIISCTMHISATGCYITDSANSNTIVMNVAPLVTPTLTISGTASPVCAGTAVLDTVHTSITGAAFQWRVNGIAAGSGGTHNYIPANGDVITCTLHTSTGCYTTDSAISNAITVVVTPATSTTLSISGPASVCAGASVTDTASSAIIGASYLWKVNGTVAGTGNTYSYIPTNGDIITCTLHVPPGCFTADSVSSNTITMTVSPVIVPTLTISGPTIACSGLAITDTAHTNAPGGTYRWEVNGITAGSGSFYSYIPADGDIISCIHHVPAGCFTADSVISNNIMVAVGTIFTPTVAISGPSAVCGGITVADTATTNVAGATYQWHVNGVNTGTADMYNYIPTDGDVIDCTVTVPIGSCYSTGSVTSNSIVMTVTPSADVLSSISADATTICDGTSVSYHAHAIDGVHFQWLVNHINAGTDDSTFSYMPADGDIIECIGSIPGGGCYLANPDTSMAVMMSVHTDTIPVITITGADTVCGGSPDVFYLVSNITGANYTWLVNGMASGSSTTLSYIPANGDVVNCTMTVPSTGCYTASADTSNSITVVYGTGIAPVTSIAADTTTVCAGTHVHLSCITNVTGATYTWLVNGTAAGGTTALLDYIPANGDEVVCVITPPAGSTCYGVTADTSNVIVITVNAHITPAITISGPPVASVGSAVVLTGTVLNAGSSYSVRWIKNGILSGTTSTPSFTYTKGAGTDIITATVTSLSPGCYNISGSNVVTVSDVVGISAVTDMRQINVYPNPANETVTVYGLSVNDRICIMDAVGRKVYESALATTNEQNIDVRNLVPGSYIIRIYNENNYTVATVKLQKD